MNWIKWTLYIVIYSLLFFAYFPLLKNLGLSISEWGNSTTKLVGELNIITSIIVEGLMVVVIGILFFIPIGGSKGRITSSLNYFLEIVAKVLDNIFSGMSGSESSEAKTAKYMTLGYNLVMLIIITMIYFALIIQTKAITNGLELIYYGIFVWILIYIINFITTIIEQLEVSKNNNSTVSIKSVLEKRNVLQIVLLIILLLFLGVGSNVTHSLYKVSHDKPIIKWFDGTRVTPK